MAIKKFSSTQPEPMEPETDRPEFKEGDKMIIDGILLQPSEKYQFVGKFNGTEINGKTRIKRRTTSKVLIGQAMRIIEKDKAIDKSQLADQYPVAVVRIKGKTGMYYLSFADPS